MIVLPPARIEAEGTAWTIRRAWPGASERLAVEASDGDGVVRAGWARAGEVELLPAGSDPKLEALRPSAAYGTVVSHRPGKRAVVVSADGSRFVKVVRPGRSGTILSGIHRAGVFDGPFRTPRVLASDDSTVVFEALPGRSLHDPGAFSLGQWSHAWDEVLTAWAEAMHRDDLEEPRGTARIHGADAEAQVLGEWSAHAADLMGAERPAFEEAVARTAVRLRDVPAGALVPAHRDLHDKQLLWDAKLGPAVLDVDTSCLADAALDLANLRAHALWRHRQGLWSASQAAVVAERIDTIAEAVRIPDVSIGAYQEATLLRLGCVYAFRPLWAQCAARLRAELAGV